MPQFKRIGKERIAYGDAKFTSYSRAKCGTAKGYGMSGALFDAWKELIESYESIAQDDNGNAQFHVSENDLEELKHWEGMAHAFLTDEDFCGLSEDSDAYKDLIPKRVKLIELVRRTDIE